MKGIAKRTAAIIAAAVCALGAFSLAACTPGLLNFRAYENADAYNVGDAVYDAAEVDKISVDWLVGDITFVTRPDGPFRVFEPNTSMLPDEKKLHWIVKDGTLLIKFWRSGLAGAVLPELKKVTVELPAAFSGDIGVYTQSSDIKSDGISGGSMTLSAVSGDIDIKSLTANALEAEAVSGEIELGAVKAETATLKTVSGDIDVDALSVQTCKAEAASGDIELGLMECSALEVKTISGDIGLRLIGGLGVTLECKLASGKFSSAAQYTMSGGKYVFGDGACRATVKAASGDVTVK